MRLVVVLPGGVATKEVMTPLEVLHERLAPEVIWAGRERGPVPGHDPPMSFHADVTLAEIESPPTVLLLPGGFGSLELARDRRALEDIRRLAQPPTICLAVSTGSLPLAAAGLINGLRVTGHWLSFTHLQRFGAVPVNEQVVVSGRFFTASGAVSAAAVAHQAADRVFFGPGTPTGAGRASLDLGQGA
ncbi:MAG TPA: DJ-1/PfpI family protein [Acidimicrobiia bacterium]|nr:DJ-1/PfpI family protein [Acidimicrobiia bacterium]